MDFSYREINFIHDCSSNNKESINKSKMCGCFYCLSWFKPELIMEWTDKGETAICPFCKVDSVLGERDEYMLNDLLLENMKEYWFDRFKEASELKKEK
ncbi:MAG: cytoplasmic protein [Nanoarchaeota archaeon]